MDRINWLYNEIVKNESLYNDIKKHISYFMQNIPVYGNIEYHFIKILESIIKDKTNGNLALESDENKILYNIFVYEYFNN